MKLRLNRNVWIGQTEYRVNEVYDNVPADHLDALLYHSTPVVEDQGAKERAVSPVVEQRRVSP